MQELCNLACQNSDLDLCNVKKLPGTPFKDGLKVFPPTWRYFPTLDPQVNMIGINTKTMYISFKSKDIIILELQICLFAFTKGRCFRQPRRRQQIQFQRIICCERMEGEIEETHSCHAGSFTSPNGYACRCVGC